MTVIAVTNQKGAVGKTTTAINVGVLLAKAARRQVLLVDSDPQGTLTRQLGIEVRALRVNFVDVSPAGGAPRTPSSPAYTAST